MHSSSTGAWQAPSDPAVLSAEEQKEKAAADKFLELLLKRPASGTALDRVFGYHVERGSIGKLIDDLTTQAGAAKADEAGRLWFLIGLLQLQRGEDAQAVKALAKGQELLKDNALVAFHHGQALILVGDTESAAAAFEVSVARKPARADYLNVARELGRLYQRAGRVEDALRIWNTLEKDFPGDDSVRQRIASTLAEEGDLKGALARYETLAKTAKAENDRIAYALEVANLRSQVGQKEQATNELDAVLSKLRPGSYLYDEARRRVERIFLSSGDFVGLTEYYQRWIKNHPDDLNVILRLARTLSLQGRSAEAIEQFEQAIKRAPNDPSPRLALIDAYLADSRFSEAAKQFEPLIASGDNNPDYLVKYGQVLMSDTSLSEEVRQKAAAEIWKRLITARPKDAAVRSQVADLMRGAKLSDEAIEQYREAINLAPEEPQHKEYLGEYLHQLKRSDEALSVWRSLAEGKQRTRDNLLRLAEILHQFQQPIEALKTMAEACELKPQVAHRLRYVDWLIEDKQFDKANDQLTLARNEAESVEDRARIFAAAVKTYQAAGDLPERVKEAIAAAEAAPTDSEKWRQLAMLHEAAQSPTDALKAIDKAVAADPTSIETLDVAARMAQDAGRIAEAITKRQRLVEIDRRFRTAHLQRLSTLYVSSGQNDKAIATGKEMLAGAGGAVEAFKFYADLCGQLGLRDERLDTLRRCLRLNPRSSEALGWLADQLSSDFKTDQAIELVWKMLDQSEEIEKKREVVGKLTELYLRNNRLDQLISRLEFRGRESNDRRTTTDLVATAYQQAGDLGLARDTLETLLREGSRDTVLLERMVVLCELAGESDRAIDFQRQIVRLSPTKQSQSRLASLLIDIGAIDEAQTLWLSTVDVRADAAELRKQIDRLFAKGEQRAALSLASKVLESNPQDWEMLFRRMVLLSESGQWKDASLDADTILAMNIPDDTLSSDGQTMLARMRNNPRASMSLSARRQYRIQNLHELYYLVDSRYSGMTTARLPSLLDFGHCKSYARYVSWKHLSDEAPEKIEAIVEASKQLAMKPEATVEQVWQWYANNSTLEDVGESSGNDMSDPQTWDDLWRLAEVDESGGSSMLLAMVSNRMRFKDRLGSIKPMSDDQLERLKKLALAGNKSDGSSTSRNQYSLPALCASELKMAGKDEEAKSFLAQLRQQEVSPQASVSSVSFLSSYGSDDELWNAVQLALDPKNKTELQNQYGSQAYFQVANMFISPERIKQELSKGTEDTVFQQRCFQLLETVIKNVADSRSPRQQMRLSSMGMERSVYTVVNGMGQSFPIAFPPTGLGPDDAVLAFYKRSVDLLEDHLDPWLDKLAQDSSDLEPRLRVQRQLSAAIFHQWREQTEKSINILKSAIELAAKEVSYEEPQLRLLLADLYLRQDRKQDALAAIEGITVYDQGTMTVREYAAAKLAVALGDQERAKQAARRLFGVRLDTETQIALARLMHSLGMPELADDLVRRMRGRTGAATQQLQTLMAYFKGQNNDAQAAEVAIELLQRSSPSRNRNSRSRSGDDAGRASALQILASAGRLKDLIASTEKRLERAPKSQRIKSELIEMYVAAGQNDKVQKLLEADGTNGDTNTESVPALQTMAKQLLTAGKIKEAGDVYLKIIKRRPQIFENDYYEIVRPLQQSKRLDELVDLILEVGLQKFEQYRVAELCGEILRNDSKSPKGRALFLAVIDRRDARGSLSNINNVFSYAAELVKEREIFDKMQAALLRFGQAGKNWDGLFQAWSTDSDGRNTNALTTTIEQAAEDPELLKAMEQSVREQLTKRPDWPEGKAWLAMILTASEQYDEATKLLQPMLSKDFKPALTYDAIWLIGSYIDQHQPMQALAVKMYDIGLELPNERNRDQFQYSLAGRACQLAVEMGEKPRAKELLREQTEIYKKNARTNAYNVEYEAYMRIYSTIGMMDLWSKVDGHMEALKLARELDRKDFTLAKNFGGDQEANFNRAVEKLLEEVRKQGGLAALSAMIDPNAKGPSAVDFAVSVDDQPFTGSGLRSVFLELLSDLRAKPDGSKDLEALGQQLNELRTARPDDLSVQFAHALVTGSAQSPEALTQLVMNPPRPETVPEPVVKLEPPSDPFGSPAPATKPAKPKAEDAAKARMLGAKEYAQLLACALLGWDQLVHAGQTSTDPKPIVDWLSNHTGSWNVQVRAGLFGSLGRQMLSRKDNACAVAIWRAFIDQSDVTAAQLIQLATAAINQDQPELAYASAERSAHAQTVGAPAGTEEPAGSLGQLLGASERTTSSSRNNNPFGMDEETIKNTGLAAQLIQLDQLWSEKQLDSQKAVAWMTSWIFAEGKQPNPLALRPQGGQEQMNVDSLFDRLSKRAAEAKTTEEVLARLLSSGKSEDKSAPLSDLNKLLIAHLHLRSGQADKALEQLKSIDTVALGGLPLHQTLQTLGIAFSESVTREAAVKLALALLEHNKPSDQSDTLQPYDSLALKVSQVAIENGLDLQLRNQAINAYIAYTVHDNRRYSGAYGVRQLIDQNEQIARPLLMRGETAEALKYLAQREPAFNLGQDYQNDWVGSWALENIQSKPDRAEAYRTLLEWTFSGDGAVHNLVALSKRAPLPAWIPESVGGKPPTFGPVCDPSVPLSSNFYSLARLALELKTTTELLQRFEAAHQAGRAGADVGLAIALATFKQPVPAQLLAGIRGRVDKLTAPAENSETQPAPLLAELQLAFLLPEQAEYLEFRQQIIDGCVTKIHRRHLMPWLARYQYQRGWSESARLKPANQLQQWLATTMGDAHSYYEGETPAIWLTDGQARLEHLCGFAADSLWLRYPLSGNFSFEFQTKVDGGNAAALLIRDLQLNVTHYGEDNCYWDVNGGSYRTVRRGGLEDIKKGQPVRISAVVEDGQLSLKIDDAEVYNEPTGGEPIWLGIQVQGTNRVSLSDIKLTGAPTIARQVAMIGKENLRGWTGGYYGQELPSIELTEVDEEDQEDNNYYSEDNPVKADQLSELGWSVKEDELISGQNKQAGPGNQALIQLSRPLSAGDKLEYEFYYSPGKFEVHPSLGRTALMLRESGIHWHWMTEPNTSWSTPADYEVKVAGAVPLTLKSDDWNKMVMETSAERVKLTLNDQVIYDQPWDYSTPGANFGLFHYRDKSQVRVRNVQLSGAWPEKLAEELWR